MGFMRSRIPYSIQRPFRTSRPQASRIIFLSCEGSVTEEEYFEHIQTIYRQISSRIQFISVAEDAVHTAHGSRDRAQRVLLSRNRAKQLAERIDEFKRTKNGIFQFDLYPDDEFWIIADVDRNWSDEIIDPDNSRTYRDEWEDMLAICRTKGYSYAVSNPFFELWLLLHHDDVNADDAGFAVTDDHPYERTSHFRMRLRNLGVPLRKAKHINPSDYTDSNVRMAVERARRIHRDRTDLSPHYLASTVYLLMEKVLSLMPDCGNRES